MAMISKSKGLSLTLFLLSTLIFAIVQSQTLPDVHTLLVQNGLPPGLLPSEAGYYSFTNGLLEVYVYGLLPIVKPYCFVRHPSSTLLYESEVSGMLYNAKLEDVKGIRLLHIHDFLPVVGIEATLDQQEFVVLPAVEFKDIPSCIGPTDGASAASYKVWDDMHSIE